MVEGDEPVGTDQHVDHTYKSELMHLKGALEQISDGTRADELQENHDNPVERLQDRIKQAMKRAEKYAREDGDA